MSDKTGKKKDITWIAPYYDLILEKIPLDTRTMLDVGAGRGMFGFIVKNTRDLEAMDAVEPFQSTKLDHYDHVYRQTWHEWFMDHPENRYDVIVCLEVVEHLDRSDALAFLDQAKSIANMTMVATPAKFEEQREYDGNIFQRHRSFLTVEDFRAKGYNVEILGNIKFSALKGRFRMQGRILYNTSFKSLMNMIGVRDTNIIAFGRNNF